MSDEQPKPLTDAERDGMLRDIHEWLWTERQARATRFNAKYEALCREENCEIIPVVLRGEKEGEQKLAVATKVN